MQVRSIFLIDPYYTDSHKAWAEGLKKYSNHKIHIFSMHPSKWKWRMEGGAIHLAQEINKVKTKPDLILVTDMLDLSLFKSLLKRELRDIPTLVYFHENQLTYPYSEKDEAKFLNRDLHYAFINIKSMLVADEVWFNSHYHKDIFFEKAYEFVARLPDFKKNLSVIELSKKSQVMYLGVDLINRFGEISFDNENRGLNILWNHRWEYDKNPIEFMKIVQHLSESEKDIRLHLLGRRFASLPQGYAKFIKDIEHLVLNESFQEEGDYIRFVKDSSCSIVTAIQDYFGISVIEAMYCGVVPFVPDRVVYPEHFSNFKNLLYHSEKDLLSKLSTFFDDPNSFDRRAIHNYARQFDWSNLISEYDQNLLKLCH